MPDRRTALHAAHVALGARMVPFGGWEMPVLYKGVLDEHKAVRTTAGVFDISHMARVDLTGPGALPLLEGTFTNMVGTMTPGQVRYGFVCNDAGGIKDDILVYKWAADDYSAVVNAGNREKILAHWQAHNAGPGATVTDRTDETVMVAVQGPRAVEMVATLVPADITAMKYYTAVRTTYRGEPAVVSRTGYTGEDGFEVTVPAASGESLWAELLSFQAVPCGLGARDTLRLEAGMPLYGHELAEDVTPLEAGLGWAVKLGKPFVGRDALQAAAVRKVRVGLELAGKRAAREGCPILVGGRPVGVVTSGSYAPGLDKSVAMGYVPPDASAAGQAVEIDIRGTVTPAVVVGLPFYKR